MKSNFTNRVLMIVFGAITFLLGCSMADMGKHKGHNPPPASTVARLVSGAFSSSHIIPRSSTLLADEETDGVVFAQALTPLAQSFDAICNNQLDFSVVGAGSFVPIPLSRAGVSDCLSFSSQIAGGGKRIHDTAALGNLVVDITLDDGSELTCQDRTDAPVVADLSLVQAYFVPSSGQTLIANDTTPTSLSCNVTLPPGRVVKQLEAQWTKG